MNRVLPLLSTLGVICTSFTPSSASAGACGVIDSKSVTSCKVYAESTCATKCDDAGVELVCSAQCTTGADANCTGTCTTTVVESCKTKCATTQGALFCDDQFLDCGQDLTPCVKEIEANGETVDNWQLDASGQVTASGSGCSASLSSGSSGGLAIALTLGVLFVVALVTNRRSNRQS